MRSAGSVPSFGYINETFLPEIFGFFQCLKLMIFDYLVLCESEELMIDQSSDL